MNKDEISEIPEFISKLDGRLSSFQREVFHFEHGGTTGSTISCGVDQAHLHLVPLPFDLVKQATGQDDVSWRELPKYVSPWSQASDAEYLSVRRSGGVWSIGSPLFPTSQWFRKLVSAEIGKPQQWDYKKFPAVEVMDKTIQLLGVANG
jgi:ATP adenylyltransferase